MKACSSVGRARACTSAIIRSPPARFRSWPARPGKVWHTDVRKLAQTEADRNTHQWSKVADDPQYRELARGIWREGFQPSEDDPPPAEARRVEQEQIERMGKAVAKLRTRGVKVLFVRMPSDGPFLAYEDLMYPRARTWQALLTATSAPGIHFEDYPQLQGYYLPEWSHMPLAEGERFTAALYGIVMQQFWGPPGAAGTAPAAGTPAAAGVGH